MMDTTDPEVLAAFFRNKVVFLTGTTGNLGLCILHKLITQLHAGRVYALVRGSRERAIAQIRDKLRDQAKPVLDSGKVQLLVGDACLPSFGIGQEHWQLLGNDVEIIIHTAAILSLLDPIDECIKNNCGPVLELARLATNFKKLQKFVFTSSAFANSFLPDGVVKERIYPLTDSAGEDIEPELEWAEINRTGQSAHTERFAWPYALSKYLAERLLLTRYSSLPLLIIRPSSISPAFATPFPLFGSEKSFPVQFFSKIYLRDPEANHFWHAPTTCPPGTNIIDEIPVDFVANVLLIHVAAQNQGVVHATARNYVQQNVNDSLLTLFRGGATDDLRNGTDFEWIPAEAGPQCALANLFVVANRDWDFFCSKSTSFVNNGGLFSIGVTLEQAQAFNDRRHRALLEELRMERVPKGQD